MPWWTSLSGGGRPMRSISASCQEAEPRRSPSSSARCPPSRNASSHPGRFGRSRRSSFSTDTCCEHSPRLPSQTPFPKDIVTTTQPAKTARKPGPPEDVYEDLWIKKHGGLWRIGSQDPRAIRALPWADMMQKTREQARGPALAAALREIAATADAAAVVALA